MRGTAQIVARLSSARHFSAATEEKHAKTPRNSKHKNDPNHMRKRPIRHEAGLNRYRSTLVERPVIRAGGVVMHRCDFNDGLSEL